MKQILKALVGSRAYGTWNADSDWDYITAHVRNTDYYLGIKSDEVFSAKQEGDTTDHEIRHFINMCCKFNPNTIIALWSPEVEVTHNWQWLLTERKLFNSKKAISSFIEFSNGQIKQAGAGGTTGKLGSKRRELIDKYGYDTKFASNAIRLAWMLDILVLTGRLNVELIPECAKILKAIRNGEWEFDTVQEVYQDILKSIRSSEKSCSLPDEPNYAEINKLMVESMKKEMVI